MESYDLTFPRHKGRVVNFYFELAHVLKNCLVLTMNIFLMNKAKFLDRQSNPSSIENRAKFAGPSNRKTTRGPPARNRLLQSLQIIPLLPWTTSFGVKRHETYLSRVSREKQDWQVVVKDSAES